MTSITDFLANDHHRCDDLFAIAESAATDDDWNETQVRLDAFLAAMRHHFAMEEEVLFPAFEQRTGMTMGPTQVMRMEHQQMRQLFDALARACGARDQDDFLGQAETLLILMQQHNFKEEQMLYPMADEALEDERDGVIGRLRAYA